MKAATLILVSAGLALVLAAGCGEAGDNAAAGPSENPPASRQPVIEEPDLYKLFGNHLYVQNPSTGFNILDVSNPKKPQLVGRALDSAGAGAEMYVRDLSAIVLLKSMTGACSVPQGLVVGEWDGWQAGSQVLLLDLTSKTNPVVVERYCIPGNLIASRTVDSVLYLVQANLTGAGSRAFSLDISEPAKATLVEQMEFPTASKEIKVTADAIYVAGRVADSPTERTGVQYITIHPNGKMAARGYVEVEGAPQGRFHMDLHEDQFRIVTYDSATAESLLHVLDVSNPDEIKLLGSLGNIGLGEKLYATRFDGELAYVVTFRQTDPLWVISLADPTQPAIVGELHVPGWSDFIFPHDELLITVGRGHNGGSLGISLFDVSNPASPKSLHQITLGDPSAQSEANVDHRAVTILKRPGQNPLVVVPHTTVSWQSGCEVKDVLRLVEVQPTELLVRGMVEQFGTIQRTLPVQSSLYSISDQEVLALDIANLDNPTVDTRVTVGDGAQSAEAAQYCQDWGDWHDGVYYENDVDGGGYPFMWRCAMDGSGRIPPPPLALMLGLLWLGLRAARRRPRR
jgi:hypothetical protein